MIAQLFFTALLFCVLVYAWSAYRLSPVVGMLTVLSAVAGLYFVWFPSHATRLAGWIGVGRGVDLILYTWAAISLILLLNIHLKMRAQMELITALARKVALSGASEPMRLTADERKGES
jgi:small membrane protein